MPAHQPDSASVHVDAYLTSHSIQYRQDMTAFAAPMVAPRIPVAKQSNKYPVFSKADFMRDEAKLRAGATESAGSGYSLSSGTYFCDQYSVHKDVPADIKANTDDPLSWRRNATQFVTQKLAIRHEKIFAAAAMATSIWETDVVGGSDFTVWSNTSTGTPIVDIETGKGVVQASTGRLPNTLVCGSYGVWKALKSHPNMVDRYKHTTAESITPEMVARVLELDRVIVSLGVENTAAEGAASASMASICGDNALLCYVPPAPALEEPSALYTYAWTGLKGSDSELTISEIDMPHLNGSTRIEGDLAVDVKVTGSDLGYFFSGAV